LCRTKLILASLLDGTVAVDFFASSLFSKGTIAVEESMAAGKSGCFQL
jgi:hypothetical protein